jgi:creatinine amidohydrolase|tara:strand:- start:21 stop:860 length:840 start_codon:yes stop_codon:yes gene_type:complete
LSRADGHYVNLTWPEVAEAAAADRVVILPVGTVEQHGPHLPLDTDNRIAEAFCAAAYNYCIDNTAVIGPTVAFGLSQHLADFPGAVYHSTSVLIDVLTEVFGAYAQAGFRRILAVNAHGSNIAPLDLASKEALHRYPGHQFASVSWWELADVRSVAIETGPPTPASHACAFETSLILAISPDSVHIEKLEAGQNYPESDHVWRDVLGRSLKSGRGRPIHLTEMWSSWSDNGVRGDPRGANAELGQAMLDAGGQELAQIVSELRNRPLLDARRGTGSMEE